MEGISGLMDEQEKLSKKLDKVKNEKTRKEIIRELNRIETIIENACRAARI